MKDMMKRLMKGETPIKITVEMIRNAVVGKKREMKPMTAKEILREDVKGAVLLHNKMRRMDEMIEKAK